MYKHQSMMYDTIKVVQCLQVNFSIAHPPYFYSRPLRSSSSILSSCTALGRSVLCSVRWKRILSCYATQSHLVQLLGLGSISTDWDYSPARLLTAMANGVPAL